jgi:hypothetical protein
MKKKSVSSLKFSARNMAKGSNKRIDDILLYLSAPPYLASGGMTDRSNVLKIDLSNIF